MPASQNPITIDAATSYYANGYTTGQLAYASGQTIPTSITTASDLVDWWGNLLDQAIKAIIATWFWNIMNGG